MTSFNLKKIQVVCRVRPTNKKELEMNLGMAVDFIDGQTISLKTTAVKNLSTNPS